MDRRDNRTDHVGGTAVQPAASSTSARRSTLSGERSDRASTSSRVTFDRDSDDRPLAVTLQAAGSAAATTKTYATDANGNPTGLEAVQRHRPDRRPTATSTTPTATSTRSRQTPPATATPSPTRCASTASTTTARSRPTTCRPATTDPTPAASCRPTATSPPNPTSPWSPTRSPRTATTSPGQPGRQRRVRRPYLPRQRRSQQRRLPQEDRQEEQRQPQRHDEGDHADDPTAQGALACRPVRRPVGWGLRSHADAQEVQEAGAGQGHHHALHGPGVRDRRRAGEGLLGLRRAGPDRAALGRTPRPTSPAWCPWPATPSISSTPARTQHAAVGDAALTAGAAVPGPAGWAATGRRTPRGRRRSHVKAGSRGTSRRGRRSPRCPFWRTAVVRSAADEYRVDPATGYVRPTHGVSVFDNPVSVSEKGFDPFEIDQSSVPSSLQIIQRGRDSSHYEITPAHGKDLTPEEYTCALSQIRCR